MTAKARFPPAFTDEGGVQVPYWPSEREMKNCAWAKRAKAECPRKKGETAGPIGGPQDLVTCASCSYHPWRLVVSSNAH